MNFDVTAIANILRTAAKAEILPRFRRLDHSQVRTKSEAIDLVTEADEAAERAIQAAVIELLPGALFLGEEAASADPTLLDGIGNAELAIVVDPIDGTANFAAGLPLFAVMAAVVRRGEVVAGIIFDPMADDWVMAEKGAGAYLLRADGETQPLRVASALPLDQMVGTSSVFFLPADRRAPVLSNLAKLRMAASYRCAGHEYRLMASGNLQFVMFNKLMPWDHLGGSLIIAEAGGHVARLDGSAYEPGHTSGGLLAAADKDSWQALRREVFTV